MIRSLEDAWRWYEAVSSLVGMMDRVARRYFHPKLGKQTLAWMPMQKKKPNKISHTHKDE